MMQAIGFSTCSPLSTALVSGPRIHPSRAGTCRLRESIASPLGSSASGLGRPCNARMRRWTTVFMSQPSSHGVNFNVPRLSPVLSAPQVTLLCRSARRRGHNLNRVLDHAAFDPRPAPFLEYGLRLESLLNRRGKTSLGCLMTCRQQKCQEIQRLHVPFKHFAEVDKLRVVSMEIGSL